MKVPRCLSALTGIEYCLGALLKPYYYQCQEAGKLLLSRSDVSHMDVCVRHRSLSNSWVLSHPGNMHISIGNETYKPMHSKNNIKDTFCGARGIILSP